LCELVLSLLGDMLAYLNADTYIAAEDHWPRNVALYDRPAANPLYTIRSVKAER
jgi:hypothetical protein